MQFVNMNERLMLAFLSLSFKWNKMLGDSGVSTKNPILILLQNFAFHPT